MLAENLSLSLPLAKALEDRILRIADSLEPDIRESFLEAVEALKRAVPINQLEDLLDREALADALQAVSDLRLTDDELAGIRAAMADASQRAAQEVAVDFGMEFNLVNPRAVRFAEEHAATLVRQVDEETMLAIRDIIVRGQRDGVNVRDQAMHIRRIVGLTSRDARAVDRFYNGLLEEELRNAETQADRMAQRLLRRRAENIARTETIRASNRGLQIGWEAAQDQGLLPQGTQKVWIATEDSRTCPICAVLDGNIIGLRTDFGVTEQATSFNREGDDFVVADTKPVSRPTTERTPPAHASCRCTLGLVFE